MISYEEWMFFAKLLGFFAVVVAIYAVIHPEEW